MPMAESCIRRVPHVPPDVRPNTLNPISHGLLVYGFTGLSVCVQCVPIGSFRGDRAHFVVTGVVYALVSFGLHFRGVVRSPYRVYPFVEFKAVVFLR